MDRLFFVRWAIKKNADLANKTENFKICKKLCKPLQKKSRKSRKKRYPGMKTQKKTMLNNMQKLTFQIG